MWTKHSFTFDIPDGAKVIGFADMRQPESLSLDEAAASAEFDFLTPDAVPAGATLVDVLNVKGMIVQQYTLTDGGAFSIAQGKTDDSDETVHGGAGCGGPGCGGQSVCIRRK